MTHQASQAATPHPAERPPQRSRARFIIPVIASGLAVGIIAAVIDRANPSMTVSEVTRAIRDVALRPPDRAEARQGGKIGPWWVAAEDCQDPLSGEFINFRLTSGDMLVAAARARLQVDPQTDTIAFEMWDVVFTRAPYTVRNRQSEDHFLHRAEHHLLGPVPWTRDIIPDSGIEVVQVDPLLEQMNTESD